MSTPALIKRYTKLVTKLKAWSPSSPTDPLIPSHSALLSSSSSLPDPSAVADADVPVIEDFLKRVEGFSREVQIAQGLGKADAPENRKGGGGGGGGKEKAEKKEGGGVGGGGVKEGVGEGKEKKAAAAPKKAKEKAVKEERKEEEAKEAQESKSLDAVQTVDTPLPAYIAHRVQVWDRIAARKDTTSSTPSTPPRAITITLPDGKQLPGTAGVTTPYDVAKQLTTNTERFVLAKVNDVQWDLHRPLEADAALVLCDFDSHEGSHTFWHSSAHLLGQAVEKEYHDVRLCVGPPLDDGGFYYDVEMGEQKVSPVDFPRLEKVVEKISRERQPFTRMELSKEEALEMFSFNPFKQEIIRSKVPDGANCTAYRCGPLIDLCIAAGTKINLANGNSVAIENVRPGDSVLSLTADGGLEPRVVAACSQPREKECVELLFADGRTLVCTADHRIRSADGRWVPAGELQLGDAVAVGIEYPSHDQLASSTSTWQMSLPGFAAFTASTWARTAAVSRMLGYSMSDGTFPDGDNSHYCGAVYLGHQFDVATFAADFLTLFGRVAPNAVPIHNTLSVQLPKVFADGLLHLGINKGNRVAVVSHFPAAFLAADCPLPVVQEFLGGLFGGDGHTFAYTHSCGVFDGLGWSCTKKGSVVREQVEVLHAELLMLLVRCGLPTDALSIIVSKPPPCQLTAAGAADTARRKDAGEKLSDQIELTDTTQLDSDMSYKIRLRIGSDAAVAFAERVGFRYCVHKQMRLTAAACWYRGRNVEMQQRSRLRALAKLPTSRTPATRLSSASLAAFAAVKLQLGKQELLHPGVASWCPSRQCHVHQSPREPAVPVQTAMTDWQLEQFFSARRVGEKYVAEAVGDVGEGAVKKQKMVNNKVTYGVHRSRASLPLFRVQLIAKRDVGKRVVYDLAVPSGDDDLDSFTAAGIVVHNCKGPHVPHSGYIKALQVTKASSAYWLAKAENPSLQRVYGISFPSKQRLKEWDALMKQAEERDHRRVGVQQRLFFFHEWSPGSCFFLPHGARLYNRLVGYIRDEYVKRGYTEVISPNVYNVELWKTSGHYQNYKENMFLFECEGQEFALKPMNCPGHCLMFGVHLHSYRDLPVRFADFGVLHRNEISGALTGLTRVRRFQQDDAHIFCMQSQIQAEVRGVLDMLESVYGVFGFKYSLMLSTRPEKYLGEVEQWNQAEKALEESLNAFVADKNQQDQLKWQAQQPAQTLPPSATTADLPSSSSSSSSSSSPPASSSDASASTPPAKQAAFKPMKWALNPGDGAFYGPKIDIQLTDALGRRHQCATIQLDFQLPIRFGLSYKTEEGKEERPVIIHRAILGSVERMIAVLIEHTGGKWPFWLSPRQVAVVPITEVQLPYARQVYAELHAAGLYVQVDDSSNTLNKKIREAQLDQVNLIAVVGAKEEQARTVTVRHRDDPDKQQQMSLEDFTKLCMQLVREFK